MRPQGSGKDAHEARKLRVDLGVELVDARVHGVHLARELVRREIAAGVRLDERPLVQLRAGLRIRLRP
jgi:hypothetical protein